MRRGTSGAGSHLNWLLFTKLSEELLPYWESDRSLIHLYRASHWLASFSNHTKIIWVVFVKFRRVLSSVVLDSFFEARS